MYIFNDNTAFTKFANEFMDRKTTVSSTSEKLFNKMLMNSSYGGDGMNMEFTRSRMVNSDQAFIIQLSPNFVDTTVITPDIRDDKGNIIKHAVYQVELKPSTFSYNTNLAAFVYTLDNAKFWNLNIVYNGMYKCLDMTVLHFIEGDTDSQAWAVAGSPDKPITQAFEEAIIDKEYYNQFVNAFFLSDFYTTDNKYPLLDSFQKAHPEHPEPLARKLYDKRLGNVSLL
jgi:hypothetical protein